MLVCVSYQLTNLKKEFKYVFSDHQTSTGVREPKNPREKPLTVPYRQVFEWKPLSTPPTFGSDIGLALTKFEKHLVEKVSREC